MHDRRIGRDDQRRPTQHRHQLLKGRGIKTDIRAGNQIGIIRICLQFPRRTEKPDLGTHRQPVQQCGISCGWPLLLFDRREGLNQDRWPVEMRCFGQSDRRQGQCRWWRNLSRQPVRKSRPAQHLVLQNRAGVPDLTEALFMACQCRRIFLPGFGFHRHSPRRGTGQHHPFIDLGMAQEVS